MTLSITGDTLLVDDYLPEFDFTRLESRVIDAPVEVAYSTVRNLDLLDVHSPITDLALFARTIPTAVMRLFGRVSEEGPEPTTMRLGALFDEADDGPGLEGWIPLAEERNRELVFGSVGRFWQPDIEWRTIEPDTFAQFSEPGWGKIAASVSVRSYGAHRSSIIYEARTALTDPMSRRRFGRYWRFVSPFAGVIMRAVLRTVDEEIRESTGEAQAGS